jgi:hypothetical protein
LYPGLKSRLLQYLVQVYLIFFDNPRKTWRSNMKKYKGLQILILNLVALALLGACSISVDSQDQELGQLPSDEWDYVALGSVNYNRTYPVLYAAHIEEDQAVEVNLVDRRTLLKTTGMLFDMIQEDETLRATLSEAEVVTIWPGGEDMFNAMVIKDQDCEPVIQALKNDLDAIVTEIIELRGDQATILRLMDHYIWVKRLKDKGIFEEKLACMQAADQYIQDVGSKYSIPVAGVGFAFNGPDGLDDPVDKGFIGSDGFRTNAAGDAEVARLLHELGYEPTIP